MKSDNDQHEIFTLRREIEMIRDHHERTQQELSSTKQTLKDAKVILASTVDYIQSII
jgi:hypothetical protein